MARSHNIKYKIEHTKHQSVRQLADLASIRMMRVVLCSALQEEEGHLAQAAAGESGQHIVRHTCARTSESRLSACMEGETEGGVQCREQGLRAAGAWARTPP